MMIDDFMHNIEQGDRYHEGVKPFRDLQIIASSSNMLAYFTSPSRKFALNVVVREKSSKKEMNPSKK